MSTKSTGYALKVMNFLATSPTIERMGLLKPIEKLTYQATKGGYRLMGKVSSQFKAPADDQEDKGPKSPLFDLSYSEEQQMMQDSVARFAADVVRPVAHDADASAKTPEDIHATFAELGINYFAIDEKYGGAATELSPTTHMLVHQTLAYGDLGVSLALLSSIGVANAINRWGNETQKSQYLPRFLAENTAEGEDSFKAALAVQEPGVLFDPQKLQTRARKKGKYYVISGKKSLVPLAQQAQLFLVAARIGNQRHGLFLVPANTKGLRIKAEPAMGLKAAATGRLVFDDVKIDASALLGVGNKGAQAFNYQVFLDYGRLAWCALAAGTCAAVRDYVIEYCNERVAFGEPISHRQSVAFKIADIATELDGMILLMQRAVALGEQDLPFKREAFLAKLFCNDKAMQIGTDGVQLLGGHGFTKEHPVERWYRDLRAIAVMDSGLHL